MFHGSLTVLEPQSNLRNLISDRRQVGMQFEWKYHGNKELHNVEEATLTAYVECKSRYNITQCTVNFMCGPRMIVYLIRGFYARIKLKRTLN